MLRHAAALAVTAWILFCGPVASAQPPSDFTACNAAPEAANLLPIHFATDRPRLADVDGHMVFGGDRPAFHGLVGFDNSPSATDHVITLGILEEKKYVDVQPVEGPKDVRLFGPQKAGPSKYTPFVQRILDLAAPPDTDLVVYVHGYNTTFKGAIDAALALRLGLSCATNFKRKIVVLFFAWPSAAKLLKPSDDEVRAEWAYRDFKDLMDGIYTGLSAPNRAPAKWPFAVAHSMGNRFLMYEIDRCEAFDANRNPVPRQCFSKVAFVAPDVDSRYFADVMFLHPDAVQHATLYVSARDKVLWASQFFHGEGRAGEGGNEFLLFKSDKIDTVDAGYMQASSLCHTYIDRPVLLFDIANAFFAPDTPVPDAPTRYVAQRGGDKAPKYFEIVENEKSRAKAACVGVPLRGQRYSR
jgi:esterase/lipase superfamily enzyme